MGVIVKFLALIAGSLISNFAIASSSCEKVVYLTFDTGNMSVAQHVAEVLKRQNVKATFFVANEKTNRGDFSLDDSWKLFWLDLIKEGHVFGSHTLNHTYWQKDIKSDAVQVKSQFGPFAGKERKLSAVQMCHEIQDSDRRFRELTGKNLSMIWRAPGGKTSTRLIAMGQSCGYKHIAWAKAGFLGDELPSSTYPNELLLKQSLDNIQNGDITMAHLGIWSRKDPWALAVLEPLIVGLKQKGFCFGTLDTLKKGDPS